VKTSFISDASADGSILPESPFSEDLRTCHRAKLFSSATAIEKRFRKRKGAGLTRFYLNLGPRGNGISRCGIESSDGSRNCVCFCATDFDVELSCPASLVFIYPIHIFGAAGIRRRVCADAGRYANRLEGKPAEVPDSLNNSLQHLEQNVEIYAADRNRRPTLATGATDLFTSKSKDKSRDLRAASEI